MKILVITPLLAQYKLQFWESIARKRDAWKLVIVSEATALSSRRAWEPLSSDLVEIIYLNSVEESHELSDYSFKISSKGALTKFLAQNDFDFVIFNNFKQLLKVGFASFFRHRYIFFVEEDLGFFSNSNFYRKFIFKIFISFGFGFIAVTDGALELLVNLGVRRDRIAKCNWVLREKIFQKRRLRSDRKRFDLVFIGQFNRRKGVDKLIELVPEIVNQKKDIKILFVGGGELEGDVFHISCKYKENVFVQLNVPSSKIPEILEKSSCLILLSREDIFGMVVLEAIENRRPVIVSKGVNSSSVIEKLGLGVVLGTTDLITAEDVVFSLSIANQEFAKNIQQARYFSDEHRAEEFASNIESMFRVRTH